MKNTSVASTPHEELMIVGLAATLPQTMAAGLAGNGVPAATAAHVAAAPPVGSLFAAFLGYNPMASLLGSPAAAGVTSAQWGVITGKTFFPHLISGPFLHGLRIAFTASLAMCVVAAWASWMRGGRYVHDDDEMRGGWYAHDDETLAAPGDEQPKRVVVPL